MIGTVANIYNSHILFHHTLFACIVWFISCFSDELSLTAHLQSIILVEKTLLFRCMLRHANIVYVWKSSAQHCTESVHHCHLCPQQIFIPVMRLANIILNLDNIYLKPILHGPGAWNFKCNNSVEFHVILIMILYHSVSFIVFRH